MRASLQTAVSPQRKSRSLWSCVALAARLRPSPNRAGPQAVRRRVSVSSGDGARLAQWRAAITRSRSGFPLADIGEKFRHHFCGKFVANLSSATKRDAPSSLFPRSGHFRALRRAPPEERRRPLARLSRPSRRAFLRNLHCSRPRDAPPRRPPCWRPQHRCLAENGRPKVPQCRLELWRLEAGIQLKANFRRQQHLASARLQLWPLFARRILLLDGAFRGARSGDASLSLSLGTPKRRQRAPAGEAAQKVATSTSTSTCREFYSQLAWLCLGLPSGCRRATWARRRAASWAKTRAVSSGASSVRGGATHALAVSVWLRARLLAGARLLSAIFEEENCSLSVLQTATRGACARLLSRRAASQPSSKRAGGNPLRHAQTSRSSLPFRSSPAHTRLAPQ